jgi:anti-sigma factor RsiW
MRCGKIRKLIIAEGVVPPPGRALEIEKHLAECAECTAYARDWAQVRTALRRVAEEPAPEPSFGFAARLVRRMPAAEAEAREVSLERTGRRFVLAGLLAAVLLMLGLVLPPSGPLRSPEAAEIQTARVEATAAQSYPLFSNQAIEGEYEFAPQSGGH